MIFGTKKVSRNMGITNFETLFSAKSQIGPKNFLKSTFFANFHEILIFENQNTIIRLIVRCLLSYVIKLFVNFLTSVRIYPHLIHKTVLSLEQSSKRISDFFFLLLLASLKLLIVVPKIF